MIFSHYNLLFDFLNNRQNYRQIMISYEIRFCTFCRSWTAVVYFLKKIFFIGSKMSLPNANSFHLLNESSSKMSLNFQNLQLQCFFFVWLLVLLSRATFETFLFTILFKSVEKTNCHEFKILLFP